MPSQFVRPDLEGLQLQVYGRALHPELFDACAVDEFEQAGFRVRIQIGRAGHALQIRWDGHTLTEVAGPHDADLPDLGRRFRRRLREGRSASLALDSGATYHVGFQIERLPADLFRHIHAELVGDAALSRVWHRFGHSGRFAAGPLSFVQADALRDALQIHTFHTFPQDLAIVKTQALLERP